MKRLLFFMFCLTMLFATFSTPAFATETDNTCSLVISDPETGDVWEFDVPESDIRINSYDVPNLLSDDGESLKNIEMSIDLSTYLNETFKGSAVSEDSEIILTTGLTYSTVKSNNTIRIHYVFGSTVGKGMYYATDRVVSWRNPDANVGDQFIVPDDSWNYPTDSKAGNYNSNLPPYSILDCNVRVTGMGGYRGASVEFNLTNPRWN